MMQDVNRGWDERIVKVPREKLLGTLKKNLEIHRREHDEAMHNYKAVAKGKLAKLHRKAQTDLTVNFDTIGNQIERFDPDDVDAISDVITLISSMTFTLEIPQDHTKSYRMAIEMAEWEVSEYVELTQSQFQCFVLDDWDWSRNFKHLNMSYRR